MRIRAPAALAIAALSLAACGGSSDGGASIKTIKITETDYHLAPSSVQVDVPGVYTFHVVNNGNLTHALEVEGEGVEAKTDDISPGSSADLEVEVTKAGSYEVYCPIGDHRKLGMEARLTVRGGTGSSETTTSGGYSY
jgi:uncharacterized cupredoxin-like copper-binding protein